MEQSGKLRLQYRIILFTFILSRVSRADGASNSKGKDDKLVLKPAELIDLILEERTRTEPVTAKGQSLQDANEGSLMNFDDFEKQTTETILEESTDDGETLKSRKVWSRWSKWGACSVSCGAGMISRRRACVAGRCARGEREEQRRACRRAPCLLHLPHEPHDSE